MSQSRSPSWPGLKVRQVLIAIMIGAAIARIGLMAIGLGRLDDPDHYLDLARSLVEGRGFSIGDRPTAYRPPLYPILLTPIVATGNGHALAWRVGTLHLALGLGTVWLVHLTARRWGLSPERCLIAAAIVAFDPVLVAQSRSVMTETPAAFLVAATLAATTLRGAKGAILGGLAFGLASLCRPSLLPGAILAAMASLAVGPGTWKSRAIRAGLLGLATLATLAPWAWRNARVLGEPVWTTTHGGYTLALANNPVYYADVLDGPPDAVWSGPNQAAWFAKVGEDTAGMSEPEADRKLRADALRMARDQPERFARASMARLGRFWGLSPARGVYPFWLRGLTLLWTGPLWVGLLVGLTDRSIWRWPCLVAPATLLALTIVHLFYWTDLRMRAPLVPAIALIASGVRVSWADREDRRSAQAALK